MVAFFCVYTFFKKMWGQQEGNPSNIYKTLGIRYFLLILVKLYYFFLPKYTLYFVYLSYKVNTGRSPQSGVFLGVIFLLYL
jgi:hypothetical protein